ncbi:D-alanyl-D-alanine carboxypeptidase/D-alanyl-D-alanine endopeptidase [Limnobacter litoralis]|uniref:D-alanyl-D-alanine carboxypeptidase n=1 Tax=Limnobacter litoralis TaxID=481366 RepID=A0ABQ5YR15_9BURK|nr:D-alanyl-D-alanine carboxypeptidase/D-alanyl-D-alanine-endopeptidase [Limnobacter litoralis]GLR26245.1 D-alanyl-D-alanine carboxypeptidase [Limnobacter litoralis]
MNKPVCRAAKTSSLAALLLIFCMSAAQAVKPLYEERPFSAPVIQAFKQAGIDPKDVTAYAEPLPPFTTRRPHSYSMGGDALANPASVTKVFTTGLALDKLGPTYRFKTDFQALDKPVDGILNGSLYIRGNGNPAFKTSDLWSALRQLRSDGLTTINGDVVLDRSAFKPVKDDDAPGDSDEFDDDAPYRAYHAQPDALLLNYGAMSLNIVPGQGGVKVVGQEAPAHWAFVSEMRLVQGGCGAWKNGLSVDYRKSGGDVVVTVKGNYPARCGESRLPIRIPNQDWLWESWFREIWTELGGQFKGRVLTGTTPSGALSLYAVYSDPLSDLIKLMNKYSSNVMARHLELAVTGPAGDFNQIMKGWLASNDIRNTDWVFENGSGLTRNNRIDARGLTDYLAYMATRSDFPDFLASLPHAGVDGTLYRHVKNIDGYGYLKTGSLNGVKTIGGYVRDVNGQWWAVGVMVRSPKAYAAWKPIENLLETLYQKD